MLVTVKDDILEMNVVARVKNDEVVYSVAVRRGGHIQPIIGTECAFEGTAEILLKDLAEDLKSGKWEIGTMNGKPIARKSTKWAVTPLTY